MGKMSLTDWRILVPMLFGEILVVESIIASVRDRQDVPDVRQLERRRSSGERRMDQLVNGGGVDIERCFCDSKIGLSWQSTATMVPSIPLFRAHPVKWDIPAILRHHMRITAGRWKFTKPP